MELFRVIFISAERIADMRKIRKHCIFLGKGTVNSNKRDDAVYNLCFLYIPLLFGNWGILGKIPEITLYSRLLLIFTNKRENKVNTVIIRDNMYYY